MSNVRALYHIVFATKFRERTITPDREEELYSYITGIVKNQDCYMLQINGMEDHIHILMDLHQSKALASVVATIKRESSKWIIRNKMFPDFMGWNDEYFAATCNVESKKNIINYIAHQKEHHHQDGFMTEIRDFYERNKMEWNEHIQRGWMSKEELESM